MPAQQNTRTAADDEAARWIARLGTRSISLETLQEFADWRRDPKNSEAYQRAEQLWSKVGDLSGDPDIQAALVRAGSRKPRRFRFKHAVSLGVATAVAASLVVCVVLWQDRGVYHTGIGEQQVVQLADGSRVRLDTNSRLKVRLGSDQRRIELIEGQAFFEVANDPGRPFIVSTPDASVTAVGTVFEVRRVGSETRVVLVSGAVDVVRSDTKAAPQRLRPNQQSEISRRGAEVTTVDAVAATSWTGGDLTFVDTPLSEAVAEVNRYLAHPIVLDAPSAADTSINGVFRSGDRAAFVSAAAQLLGLRAVIQPNGEVHLVDSRNNYG